jgi:Tol biopolymer transport system component
VPKSLRLSLSLVLLVMAALALGASTASAAPKEVAYRCGPDICLLDPDNPAAVFNLTDNEATSYDQDPVWSPDGKRLAFVAEFTQKFPQEENIYTMEPEGPGQTFNAAVQITHFTNGLSPTREIAWSPDGTKIAFVRGNANPGSQPLYVVRADGTSANATEIPTVGGAGHPTWSADSGKIAFWHSNQIYTVAGDISIPASPLSGAAGVEPAWSPDGSRIAYGTPNSGLFLDLQIIGAGGGTPLVTFPDNTQFITPSWSPSGVQLAYNERVGEPTRFRIVNADGSGNHGLPLVEGLKTEGSQASWSPDGTRLVFQGWNFGGVTPAEKTNEVYIANADGSGSVTPLTPDQGYSTEPAWRPNPVAHPGPPVITPSGPGGSSGPLQGPTIKPQLKWFTNRIPWSEAPYVEPLKVFCGAPACNVNGTGTAKGSVAAGIRFRPNLAATASAKPKGSKKPKTIVVASGKVYVPSNQTRALKLNLTKVAIAILKKVGKLKMTVTVTTTIAGQAPTKETRSFEIVAKPKKKAKQGS